MRASRRMAVYASGGGVLYNIYNSGTISDAAGGFVKTAGYGFTLGTSFIQIGGSSNKNLTLIRTEKMIDLKNVSAITASVRMSARQAILVSHLGYSANASVTTLAGLSGYVSKENFWGSMLVCDTASETGKAYAYLSFQATSSPGAERYNVVEDISLVVNSGVNATGSLYDNGVVHPSIEEFVRSGSYQAYLTQAVTYNAASITLTTTNYEERGVFIRTKYPVKMGDLTALSAAGTKVATNGGSLCYLGWAREGSVMTPAELDGKVSFYSPSAWSASLNISSVTGYAYLYLGIMPTATGYASVPTLTLKSMSVS